MAAKSKSRDIICSEEPSLNRTYPFPPWENCTYTSCYCEENVWKLCDKVKENQEALLKTFAVFVSNSNKVIPLWCQKSGAPEESGLVLWDYHVFLIYADEADVKVYDLDSVLEFPTSFSEYVLKAICNDSKIKQEFKRHFRVIRGDQYLKTFASDRRHMQRSDNTWLKEPPNYPPIQSQGSIHNLDEFISMDPRKGVGDVLNFDQFIDWFTSREWRVV